MSTSSEYRVVNPATGEELDSFPTATDRRFFCLKNPLRDVCARATIDATHNRHREEFT